MSEERNYIKLYKSDNEEDKGYNRFLLMYFENEFALGLHTAMVKPFTYCIWDRVNHNILYSCSTKQDGKYYGTDVCKKKCRLLIDELNRIQKISEEFGTMNENAFSVDRNFDSSEIYKRNIAVINNNEYYIKKTVIDYIKQEVEND